MAGFNVGTNDHLIRSNLWTAELKEAFLDELFAMKYVRMLDFPDGTTLNIPSIGQTEAYNYSEGEAIKYTAMDTGNFTFTITEYLATGTYISNQMKQDSFYMSELVSSFIPKQRRAIMKRMEVDILNLGPAGQTVSNLNAINGANHRYTAHGSSAVLAPKDFALAKYALRKSMVPMTNLTAIVDPSVEYNLSIQTGLVDLTYNPKWEGIITTGMSTGMRFLMNIYGFDVYVSDNLPTSTVTETINSVACANPVTNIFFSAAGDAVPFVGNVRQQPKVDSEFNKDYQREEYVTTCRYGLKLYRPENLVCVNSDSTQVS